MRFRLSENTVNCECFFKEPTSSPAVYAFLNNVANVVQ